MYSLVAFHSVFVPPSSCRLRGAVCGPAPPMDNAEGPPGAGRLSDRTARAPPPLHRHAVPGEPPAPALPVRPHCAA